MAAKRPTLSIPEPCHEAWDQMTPQARGRHCASCGKLVVDFSRMSDQQLIDYLQQAGKTCGRFRADQLQRPLMPDAVRTQRRWTPALFFSSLLAAATLPTHAQETSQTPSVVQRNMDGIPIPVPEIKEDTAPQTATPPVFSHSNIHGTVVDAETREPLPFANVYIKGTRIGTTTDFDGRFELTLPEDTVMDDAHISVMYIGYQPTSIPLSSVSESNTTVLVVAQEMIMMGIVVYDPTPAQKVRDVVLRPIRRVRYALQRL